MTSTLRWTGWRRSILPLDPQTKLRRALSRYGIRCRPGAAEQALDALPPSAPPETIEPAAKQTLVFPLPATPDRIAVIGGRFSMTRSMRQFDATDMEALIDWRPDALVAPLEQALIMADLALLKLARTPNFSTALIVLSSVGSSTVAGGSRASTPDEDHRDRLWAAFGVPIFEQLQAWDGTVIARECEVHEGLHIVEKAAMLHRQEDGELLATLLDSRMPILKARTGLQAEIVRDECECGSEVPRLLRVQSMAEAAEVERESGETKNPILSDRVS